MICEYEYCIYNSEGVCLVEKITINDIGMCDECIVISLEKDFLQSEKKRLLEEIDKRWKESEFPA